jgi:hypothetical protein
LVIHQEKIKDGKNNWIEWKKNGKNLNKENKKSLKTNKYKKIIIKIGFKFNHKINNE